MFLRDWSGIRQDPVEFRSLFPRFGLCMVLKVFKTLNTPCSCSERLSDDDRPPLSALFLNPVLPLTNHVQYSAP